MSAGEITGEAVVSGARNSATGSGSTAFGVDTTASGFSATAFGQDTVAGGGNSTAFGLKTTASGSGATTFGHTTIASGNFSTAWGSSSTASGICATAWGSETTASGAFSTAFGSNSKAAGRNSLAALGGIAEEANSVAIGLEAQAVLTDSIALGSGAEARRMAGVTGFAFGGGAAPTGLAWQSTHAAIAVGSDTVSRQITGVAAGSQDTDAVNLAQLKQAISTVGGGGTGVDNYTTKATLGADKKLTFTRTDGHTYDVDLSSLAGSGTGAADTYTTGVNVSGNTVTFTRTDGGTYSFDLPASAGGGGMNSLQFAGDDGAIITKTDGQKLEILGGAPPANLSENNIGVASEGGALKIKLSKDIQGITSITTDSGVKIDENGINAGDKKITGVADGENDTDAVNMRQLKAMAGTAPDLAPVNNRISLVDSKVNKVGAGAAALAALHPLDMDNKFGVAAGFGNYRDANALALGVFYRPAENVMFSAGGAMGNGENMVNVGVSFALDKGQGVRVSKAAMAKKINVLTEENMAMKQEIGALKAALARLEAKIK